jgi:hypothetical protein
MKTGRPTKMNTNVVYAMEQVITENVLYCTDEDLVLLINERLPPERQFSYESFSKWKRGQSQNVNPLYSDFLRLIKKALISEKTTLLKSLHSGTSNWQARAWILERKFEEWNIKSKTMINLNIEKLSDEEITGILNRLLKHS